jgi:hypothetical protein
MLRGERAEIYLDGAARHSVCELCTSRALHGGWVREGTKPAYDGSNARVYRRRSLLSRLRGRRDPASASGPRSAPEPVDEPRPAPPPAWVDEAEEGRGWPAGGAGQAGDRSRSGEGDRPRQSNGGGRKRPVRAPRPIARAARMAGGREPRHVRAVPTSIEHRIASAVSLFNDSEHPRTVAGIGRSLGLADVSVHPSDATGSLVLIVVSWELCWYRYEVDLSDEVPSVRVAGQGYELDELSALERQINAAADERGVLSLGGATV